MTPTEQAQAVGDYWDGHPGPEPEDASQAELDAYNEQLGTWKDKFGDAGPPAQPPEPPVIPWPPSPGVGMQAARVGDLCTHGGTITGPGSQNVWIGDLPAARANPTGVTTGGDQAVCPLFNGPTPHVKGTILMGSTTVLINDQPAARVADPIGPMEACAGNAIAVGQPKVLIGDAPGAGGGAAAAAQQAAEAAAREDPVRGTVVREQLAGRSAEVSPASPDQVGPLAPVEPAAPGEPTWIGVKLKDFDGTPMPNQDFTVTLETGQVLQGRTNEEGYARFAGLRPDQGDVTFTAIPETEEAGDGEHGRPAALARRAECSEAPAAPPGDDRPR